MTNVLGLLTTMSWRGTEYPVTDRNVSFLHENVDHRIQYRNNDFPEPIGPHSFLFKYTIPMREDIAVGKYENLFNEGLIILLGDMRSKEPGDLNDPVYGTYRCVPVSYSETTDVNKRDGTDVSVEFIHSPRIGDSDPELPTTITGLSGLVGDAGLLDEDLKAKDWNQEPSPEGTTSILNAINGYGRQGLRQIDKVSANLDSLAAQMQKIEDTADLAENPQNWQIRDSARNLHLQILQAKNRLTEDPVTKVARILTKTTTTVSSMAADSGMTIAELLSMNPSLARSPVIPPGIRLYLKKKIDKTRSN
jgi:hypothetical protein